MKNFSKTFGALCVLFSSFSNPLYANEHSDEINQLDVLVVYNKDFSDRYSGDPTVRIEHLFNVTNDVYDNSGVKAELNLIHSAQVDHPTKNGGVQTLRDLTNGVNGFENVSSLKEEYNADMVLFYRPYDSSQGGCGVAWVGGNQKEGDMSLYKDYMYAVSAGTTCSDHITGHELGHNLGLKHSRVQDGEGGTFDHALGYGVNGNFTTMMGYTSVFGVNYWSGRIYKFSSPDLTCNGEPCGIDKELPSGADAVHALNHTIPQVANYRSQPLQCTAYDSLAAEIEQLTIEHQEVLDEVRIASFSLGYIENRIGLYQRIISFYGTVLERAIVRTEQYYRLMVKTRGDYIASRTAANKSAYLRALSYYSRSVRSQGYYQKRKDDATIKLENANANKLSIEANLEIAQTNLNEIEALLQVKNDELEIAGANGCSSR